MHDAPEEMDDSSKSTGMRDTSENSSLHDENFTNFCRAEVPSREKFSWANVTVFISATFPLGTREIREISSLQRSL